MPSASETLVYYLFVWLQLYMSILSMIHYERFISPQTSSANIYSRGWVENVCHRRIHQEREIQVELVLLHKLFQRYSSSPVLVVMGGKSQMNDFDTLTSQYSPSVTTQPAVNALLMLTSDPGCEAFSSPSPPRSTSSAAVNEFPTVSDALCSDPQCDCDCDCDGALHMLEAAPAVGACDRDRGRYRDWN